MKEVKIEERVVAKEKKMVALEMSREMWKEIRYEAVNHDLTFSAMVRLILGKYLTDKERGGK